MFKTSIKNQTKEQNLVSVVDIIISLKTCEKIKFYLILKSTKIIFIKLLKKFNLNVNFTF